MKSADTFRFERYVPERNAATSPNGNGPEPEFSAVRRHPRLFRAAQRRRYPRLRRSDITVTDERAVKRAVKAASLGNAMEWFDFGIYAYLAGTIGRVFFPSGNETVQLLSSWAPIAVAVQLRTLGGMVVWPKGEKIVRQKVQGQKLLLNSVGHPA
ncbi:MFS transporter, partial [Streptomyces sp. NPDC059515]